jgi:hypothetical protein
MRSCHRGGTGRVIASAFLPGAFLLDQDREPRPAASCVARRLSCTAGMVAVALMGMASATARAQELTPTPAPAAASERSASFQGYRAHLEQLESLTAACAKGRDKETCDPSSIGSDDVLPVGGEQRLVSYAWLRVLFARAQEPDAAVRAPGSDSVLKRDPDIKSDVLTTSELLIRAQARLAADLEQADRAAGQPGAHAQERAVLKTVLAGREFRGLKQSNNGPTVFERINNWLNTLFGWLGSKQVHARWIGRVLIWGFLTLVGVGLVWALLQWERRWRIRLVPDSDGPAPTAASARDWQLWLKDAREAAGRGDWREAIHFLYWAAISRLESKRLWPSDRARTPREYLALVSPDDPRKPRLGALTREFEWTWYGGRPADEPDYRRAEELAMALVEGAANQGGPAR